MTNEALVFLGKHKYELQRNDYKTVFNDMLEDSSISTRDMTDIFKAFRTFTSELDACLWESNMTELLNRPRWYNLPDEYELLDVYLKWFSLYGADLIDLYHWVLANKNKWPRYDFIGDNGNLYVKKVM